MEIAISTSLPLANFQVFVQREPNIAKKLAAKTPQHYDVGFVPLFVSNLKTLSGKLVTTLVMALEMEALGDGWVGGGR